LVQSLHTGYGVTLAAAARYADGLALLTLGDTAVRAFDAEANTLASHSGPSVRSGLGGGGDFPSDSLQVTVCGGSPAWWVLSSDGGLRGEGALVDIAESDATLMPGGTRIEPSAVSGQSPEEIVKALAGPMEQLSVARPALGASIKLDLFRDDSEENTAILRKIDAFRAGGDETLLAGIDPSVLEMRYQSLLAMKSRALQVLEADWSQWTDSAGLDPRDAAAATARSAVDGIVAQWEGGLQRSFVKELEAAVVPAKPFADSYDIAKRFAQSALTYRESAAGLDRLRAQIPGERQSPAARTAPEFTGAVYPPVYDDVAIVVASCPPPVLPRRNAVACVVS